MFGNYLRRKAKNYLIGWAVTIIIFMILIFVVASRDKFDGGRNISRIAQDIISADRLGIRYDQFIGATGHDMHPLTFARLINLRRNNNFTHENIVAELNY